MYVILVYDISLKDKTGTKVLNNIYKICKKYLSHTQNSVFEGELSVTLLNNLKKELTKFIRTGKDSVIFFEIPYKTKLNKSFLGIYKEEFSNFL